MNHYPHHLGDYATGTQGFTTLEHGVYRLLMDAYYSTEAALMAEDVYAIAKAGTVVERKAVEKVLARKFVLRDGCYRHERIEAELAIYREKAEVNRTNGKRGGRPKNKPGSNPKETQTVSEGEPRANPEITLASSQEPVTKNPPVAQRVVAGTSVPDDAPLAALASVCIRNRVSTDGGKALLHLRQFAAEGVTEALLADAVLVARDRKPDPEIIPIAYLAPIVADLRAGRIRARPLTSEEAIAQTIERINAKEAANAAH